LKVAFTCYTYEGFVLVCCWLKAFFHQPFTVEQLTLGDSNRGKIFFRQLVQWLLTSHERHR